MEFKNYFRAKTLQEAHQTLLLDSNNVLLGGGLWIKRMSGEASTAIDLTDLKLNEIIDKGDFVEVGTMVNLRDFEQNPLIKSLNNGFLSTATGLIMGVGFRRLATMGGSIAGRFPFSDLITPLLTLDVTLVFYPKKEMSLEAYLKAKGKSSDILTHILIKKEAGKGFFKKVSNTVLDFSILNIAVSLNKKKYSIVLGARPAGAVLALEAMAFLNSIKKPGLPDFEKAAEMVIEKVSFATTNTATSEYRKTLAKTYVRRGLEEVSK